MSNRQITIAVDAMGGENSPFKCLKGIEIFSSKKSDVKFKIYGDEFLISKSIKDNNLKINNYEIINCIENVLDDDNASTILRSRKKSSIYQGLLFVKENSSSGFVSSGNTAALMILSRLIRRVWAHSQASPHLVKLLACDCV